MSTGNDRGAFPMTQAAQTLNQRLGLYLSEGQQRGLAAGLLLGAVLGSAALVYGMAAAVRRGVR